MGAGATAAMLPDPVVDMDRATPQHAKHKDTAVFAGADAERLAVLTGYLRTELMQLDVEDVTAPQAGESPPGTRAVGAAALGALLVALGQSAEGLRSVGSVVSESSSASSGEGTS